MSGILCWHRLQTIGKHCLCRYCGVLIEECPDHCPACFGSDWVAVIRGARQKFSEYIDSQEMQRSL